MQENIPIPRIFGFFFHTQEVPGERVTVSSIKSLMNA